MSSKTNDSIKRTGDLLLNGWRLLNSACPICNTALLSKNELLRCPTCDLAVVKEADQQKYTNEPSTLPKPPAVAEAKFEIEDDYYQYATGAPAKFESLNEAKKLYDQQNKKMNQVSDKLGAKMLAGFSMLSTVCPNEACRGTPLCRQGSGPMVCVCCDAEYKVSSLGDLIPTLKTASASETFNGKITAASVQAIATPAPTSTSAAPSGPSSVNLVATADEILPASAADNAFFLNMQNAPILDLSSFARESESDASSKIARKLMLGWALLDKCCVQKGCAGEVPLMRDSQGTERCVQCGFPDNATPIPTNTTASASFGQDRATPGPTHNKRSLAMSQLYPTTVIPRKPSLSSGSESSSAESDSNDDLEDSDDEEADIAMFHAYRAASAAAESKHNRTSVHSSVPPAPSAQQAAQKQKRGAKMPVFASTSRPVEVNGTCMPTAAGANREVQCAMDVVKQKLTDSAVALASAHNLDTQIKYAELIGKLAGALQALQKVDC